MDWERLRVSSPCHAESDGCAFMRSVADQEGQGIYGANGQPRHCGADVVVTGRAYFPASGEVWQVFACDYHRRALNDPEARPLNDRDRATLDDRRRQKAAALAAQPYRRPEPLRRSQGRTGATHGQ